MKKNGLSLLDWIIFFCIAVVSFVLFCHVDILITANHSYAYLNGHVKDFYSGCFAMNDTYSANYLPTSFLLFAVWNIPLKLIGMGPKFWADWNLIFIYWNKLLPVGVYFLSGLFLKQLCEKKLMMGSGKARMVMYVFLTMPIGFFSQFMFCQYDIFTVLFLLFGMWYYFSEDTRGNWLRFLLLFGVACSVKYFALLVLIVFVFLKEKNVWKILGSLCIALVPAGLECGFYFLTDRVSFLNSILGFGVLEYANVSAIDIGFASIRLLIVSVCIIGACAYFTKCRSEKELLSYCVFYVCGMFCALFCFMTWHPQWLLIAVPFWTLGACMNKNHRIMFWLELLMGVVFIVFIVNAFKNNVDQSLLKNGLFSYLLQFNVKTNNNLSNLFRFKDKDVLFSILTVIMAAFFFFNHPRFHMDDFSAQITDSKLIVVGRFTIVILLFVGGSVLLLPQQFKVRELLWNAGQFNEKIDFREELITGKENFYQYATIPGDRIDRVSVFLSCFSDVKEEQELEMIIYDPESNEKVASSILPGSKIKEGGGFSNFVFKDCNVQPGKQYAFTIIAQKGASIPVNIRYGATDMTRAERYKTVQKDYSDDYIMVRGKKFAADQYHMVSTIEGLYKKPHYGLY